MVKARDIGILALLGLGAFALSKKASANGVDFGAVPATPFSILEAQKIQVKFDELGDVLEQQNTALIEAQRLLGQQQQQQTQIGLNQSVIPSGALLGLTFGQPFRRAEQRQRSSQLRGSR